MSSPNLAAVLQVMNETMQSLGLLASQPVDTTASVKAQKSITEGNQKNNIEIATGVESRRLFHGRGGTYEGLSFVTVDLFYPVIKITYFSEPPVDWHQEFVKAVHCFCEHYRLACATLQRRYRDRAPYEVLWGIMPEQVVAVSGGLAYHLQLTRNQNSGFFLDMRPGHRWLELIVKEASMLNLFAYTCAFSVVAKHVGAKRVVNIDMSKSALKMGKDNHRLNDLSLAGVEFLPYDIFRSLGKLTKKGPFDIVVCDPPTYQKGSFVAERDYPRLAKRFSSWVMPGGLLLLCLNSPTLDIDFLQKMMTEMAPGFDFMERLTNATDFPDIDSQRSLKLMVYRNPRDDSSS